MDKDKELENLKRKMEEDTSLPLKNGATNLVFGVGDANSRILFIGEGPGYNEDQQAEPFVGVSGKFLNSLLLQTRLSREEVYITNVVHHRPPNNRDPLPEELSAYGEYLDKMIEIINPEIVVTLGRFSMAKFLPGVKISGIHGKVHTVNWKGKDLVVVPMYHPAAGLRNPNVKEQTIRDFRNLKIELEKPREIKVEQMELV